MQKGFRVQRSFFFPYVCSFSTCPSVSLFTFICVFFSWFCSLLSLPRLELMCVVVNTDCSHYAQFAFLTVYLHHYFEQVFFTQFVDTYCKSLYFTCERHYSIHLWTCLLSAFRCWICLHQITERITTHLFQRKWQCLWHHKNASNYELIWAKPIYWCRFLKHYHVTKCFTFNGKIIAFGLVHHVHYRGQSVACIDSSFGI